MLKIGMGEAYFQALSVNTYTYMYFQASPLRLLDAKVERVTGGENRRG